MTATPQNSGKSKKVALQLYVAVVVLVFTALMATLFTTEAPQPQLEEIPLEDEDVVAILEEYRDDRVSRVSVSLDDIEEILPAAEEPAWRMHAVSAAPSPGIPKIAIIIDDLGLSRDATAQLAGMQGPYTLSFLPYAEELHDQTQELSRAGHELMVHLPMQSHSTTADPGTNALVSGLSFDEFGRRLEWNLKRFEGFVGVNNHMGSLLTEDPVVMVRLMARLRRDGYLFVDSLTTPRSMGRRAAHATNVPFLARDIFLDNERDPAYIRRQLEATEQIAKMRGYAIAIGHPYAETLDVLTDWQRSIDFKGFELVPVSEIMMGLELSGTISSR